MIKDISPSKRQLFAAELVLCILCVAVPLSVQAGFWLNVMGTTASEAEAYDLEVVNTGSLIDVPVLTAAINPDPHGARGGDEVIAADGALVSTGPVGQDEIDAARKNTGEISVYTVRVGDSLSQIAEMFNVTANTILWANDIPSAKSIQPGDTLVILPVAGVRHVVKSGDTIASIAKKYEGDVEEILSYNQLEDGTELSVGETLVIPGGALHSATVQTSAKPVKSSASTNSSSAGSSNLSHPLPGATKTQGIHGYNGVDLAAPAGTGIRASAAGEVIVSKSTGWNGGYGSYIVIKHSNGVQTLYAHLSRNDVGVGAYVATGEIIGGVGNTGKSTGTHLHFEVRGAKNPF